MNLPCFLIPILVGIISGILGYLIGKITSKSLNGNLESLQIDLETCNRHNSQLRKDLDQLKSQTINKSKNEKTNFTSKLVDTSLPYIIPFNTNEAKAVFGKKINENDLKIIEGIGPKIEELFKNSGIKTWKSLSETSIENCKKILLNGGERYTLHDPGTWPKQAKLAYEGKWQELKDWQNKLDGGREK